MKQEERNKASEHGPRIALNASYVAPDAYLLHGESLLVISSGDLEDISLEVIAEVIARHLVGDTLVVEGAATQRHNTATTRMSGEALQNPECRGDWPASNRRQRVLAAPASAIRLVP